MEQTKGPFNLTSLTVNPKRHEAEGSERRSQNKFQKAHNEKTSVTVKDHSARENGRV